MDTSSTPSSTQSALILVSVALSCVAFTLALGAVVCIRYLHGRREGENKAASESIPTVAPSAATYAACWPPQDPIGLRSDEFGPQRNLALAMDRTASTHQWTPQAYGQGRRYELHMNA